SIWFGTILRGDVAPIRVGAGTNLQDGTIVHVTEGVSDVHIGDGVLVGHAAIIHGATLEDGAFVGMQAVVLDGARVKTGAMVAAGALVAPGKTVETGQVWAGRPAKYMRDLKPEEIAHRPIGSENYRKLGAEFKEMLEDPNLP
ncbi:MAG: gamma carbonic anhydrase family protein, partial [Rhodospirillales bacterium]|nr:gamma carbonic anhydrase family protein [Rhodospirillales bacterium]